MQTSLRIEGANCSACLNETLDALTRIDGVRRVQGSFAGACIDIDHGVAIETITGRIRSHQHGVEMFSNEIRVVPLDVVPLSLKCSHQ